MLACLVLFYSITAGKIQIKVAAYMAMPQPLRTQRKKKMVMFIGLMLQHREATTSALQRVCNGNNNDPKYVKILCRQGRLQEAVYILHVMDHPVDKSTYVCLLRGCIKEKALSEGKLVHAHMKERGFTADIILRNTLVNMYAKCGSLAYARSIFEQMPKRTGFSWTVMIAAYAKYGFSKEALALFHQMPGTGFQPDQFTFASVLPACDNLALVNDVHEQVVRSGFQSDVFVGSALVDMYAKCGNIENARMVFDRMPQRDDFSWNAIIAAYARHGFAEEALTLFHQMQRTSIQPNQFTFASVLPACADLAALEQGMEIHHEIIRNGFQSDVFLESALVDMYAKCGSIDKARDIFDKMHQRDVVSWTAMIVGFTQNGHAGKALKLFRQMQLADVKPDSKTFAGIIPACSILAALEQGMEIHEEVIKSGFQSDISVANALVDMYAKCGSIDKARNVFDKMHQRNTVSWTAMIAGYAMHGCGKEAIKLFEQMQQSGTNPNHVTLVCVLSACCHAGLVNEGLQYFDRMIQYYDITPAMEHYGCMVDLLCRAGRLDEAKDFMNKMPIEPDAAVWGCLLGACRIYNNIEIGECVAEHLFELDPQNATPYVLLSNIYAAAGRWEGIDKVRKIMKDRRVIKTPGCSWIKVNKKVHAFLVGDRSHPQTENLCKVGEII
eukprot:Gb_16102 [translate_table: standard]